MDKIYRILDANVNRVAEGIRVVEDIARFYFENEELTSKLREMRHKVRKNLFEIDELMIKSRDSKHDIGVEISSKSKLDSKKDLKQLLNANFKRSTEGLRVIEENLKIIGRYDESKKIESLRYSSYYLEKEVLKLFKKEIPFGIYGITSEKDSLGRSNIEIVKKMIKAGIKIIQYREKQKSFKEMYMDCLKIREITKKAGVVFIVNDYIELAMMVDADGVHIGQDDWPIEEARKILGDDKIIGMSTHCQGDAENAVKKGADYIGVGPIFKTQTKDREPVGLEYLEYVVKNITIPFVAIGGIKEENISEIVGKGAKRIALVTEIVGAEDVRGKIKSIMGKVNMGIED